MTRRPRRPAGLAVALSLVILCGCTRMGERFTRVQLPEGAPDPQAILEDLRVNDEALQTFSAKGDCIVGMPDIVGKRRFDGDVDYQRPDKLRIRGSKAIFDVFDLTCVGGDFIARDARTGEEFYEIGGIRSEGLEMTIHPLNIVNEMFFPEPWGKVKPRQLKLVDYDSKKQIVTAELWRGLRCVRRLRLEGAPWVIIENQLLDKNGEVVAITELENYWVFDGIRFPLKVRSEMPSEETELRLRIRKGTVRINAELDEALFSIEMETGNP